MAEKIPAEDFVRSFIKAAVENEICAVVIFVHKDGTRLATRMASTSSAAATRNLVAMITPALADEVVAALLRPVLPASPLMSAPPGNPSAAELSADNARLRERADAADRTVLDLTDRLRRSERERECEAMKADADARVAAERERCVAHMVGLSTEVCDMVKIINSPPGSQISKMWSALYVSAVRREDAIKSGESAPGKGTP